MYDNSVFAFHLKFHESAGLANYKTVSQITRKHEPTDKNHKSKNVRVMFVNFLGFMHEMQVNTSSDNFF